MYVMYVRVSSEVFITLLYVPIVLMQDNYLTAQVFLVAFPKHSNRKPVMQICMVPRYHAYYLHDALTSCMLSAWRPILLYALRSLCVVPLQTSLLRAWGCALRTWLLIEWGCVLRTSLLVALLLTISKGHLDIFWRAKLQDFEALYWPQFSQ